MSIALFSFQSRSAVLFRVEDDIGVPWPARGLVSPHLALDIKV